MTQFGDLFRTPLPVIGMVHLPPLPGSPGHCMGGAELETRVLRDVEGLLSGGVDGLVVENFGDAPYFPHRVPPETVAAMTLLAHRVRAACDLPIGINVLRNDGLSAIAIAATVGAQFVRVNVYTGARLTDQGLLQGEAHRLQRFRKALGADVKIVADVAVKHSASLGEQSLSDEVEDTIGRGRADAIVVSGTATGRPTSMAALQEAKRAAGAIPVLVGSGVTRDTATDLLAHADGLIVGTAFKDGGAVTNPVSPARVREIVRRAQEIRSVR